MKLVGILCWYDEPAAWLASAVASFARLGLDHVICLDGAFDLYPDGMARSGAEQHEALQEIVRPFGTGLTLHVPDRTWKSEMEKRSLGFALAEQLTEESDWYVVFDADELAETFPLKQALADTKELAAECDLWERPTPGAVSRGAVTHKSVCRRFYRALRGMKVEGTHYHYQAGDVLLRGNLDAEVCPGADLPMRVEHRWNFKDPERRLKQETYYRRRDDECAERGECHCGEPAVMIVPTAFVDKGGSNGNVNVAPGKWVEVCQAHLPPLLAANEHRLAQIGAEDPKAVLSAMGLDYDRALWLANRASTSKT